jgi:hypothetical protein
MKKASIVYLISCLVILYVVLLYNMAYQVNGWLESQERDLTDFLYFKKEDVVALLLVILSIAGILVRERSGWILTIQLFYALLGASITFLLKLTSSMQLIILVSMVLLLLPPLVVMNSKPILDFYRMNQAQNRILNNALAILLALLASMVVW